MSTQDPPDVCRAADEGLAPPPTPPSVPRPAARVGDRHDCPEHQGGPVSPPGSPNVWIEGRPAARSFSASLPTLDPEAAVVIQQHARELQEAASSFSVDPLTLAAIIYVEQVHLGFVDRFEGIVGFYGVKDTSIGIAQVKLSTAKLMEEEGRMPAIHASDGGWRIFGRIVQGTETMAREKALVDPAINARYAAANLRSLIELWQKDYPSIASDPEILATIHQMGREKTEPNDHPCSNPFGKEVLANYDAMRALLGLSGADLAACTGGASDLLWQGSATVLINGLPATRVGDQTLHRGQPVEGATTVWIG